MPDEEVIAPSPFRVEVQNPEGIFNMLRKREAALDPETGYGQTDEELSSTKLDGDLVKQETTYSDLYGGIEGTQIMIQSSIDISEVEQQTPEQGYFSDPEVKKIQETLQQRGLSVAVSDVKGQNSLDVFLDNDVIIKLDLGYKSKEAKAAGYRELPRSLRKQLIRRVLRETETEFANDTIQTALYKRKQSGGLQYFPLTIGFDDFNRVIQTYAQGYQHILEAIHLAKGKKLPEKPIILSW